MRQKRAKSYRRLVHQYVLHYRFREPFQVLIDNTFAESLVRYQVQEPTRQLGQVLQGKVKPMITQCCMVALYDAEKEAEGEEARRIHDAIAQAKTWERRKCNHREAQTPSDCLASVIGPTNQHRYILAADDAEVRRARRKQVPGLPILHYAQSVLILEPMSDVTERHIAQLEANKSAVTTTEKRLLAQADTAPVPAAPAPVKRKRAKEPNPLSVKKKKGPTAPAAPASDAAASGQRRRSKKRGRGSQASTVP
ncbi:hypothetical protein MNAN1_001789 [Malassezia nana]|uniref:U three protein 23 n=1 Tax=Malassezia nana TaxID=180528 RepID=A0AAF0EHV4_9BASI|nr:hypothetical protein MNAN1_001789 [Malassezia nana]